MDTSAHIKQSSYMSQKPLELALRGFPGSDLVDTTLSGPFQKTFETLLSSVRSQENLIIDSCRQQQPVFSWTAIHPLRNSQIYHLSRLCEIKLRTSSKVFTMIIKAVNSSPNISFKETAEDIQIQCPTLSGGVIEYTISHSGFSSLIRMGTSVWIYWEGTKHWSRVGSVSAAGWVLYTSRYRIFATLKYTVHRWSISIRQRLGI